MKTIAYNDQHDLGLTTPNDQDLWFERRAARAVLHNDKDQVAIMHFRITGSYKLPGGGVDEGEDILTALHREVREETGYTITDILELGIVEENRYFNGMHQISYCFDAKTVDFVGTELTTSEQAQGMELAWFNDIDAAIDAINSASESQDSNDSGVGLHMMKLRDTAILRATRELTKKGQTF